MVRDARNKEILEFANVVLQTMDSSFVAGTTTDMKGHFLLNKIKKGSYILSVSSLGFKTEYISLEGLSKNISLGEISLNDDAVSLDGVTVSASAQTSHADKKVVFPSDRQIFHKVRTVHAGFERLFQMLGLHQRGLLHGGHRGGFDHHVAHERELKAIQGPCLRIGAGERGGKAFRACHTRQSISPRDARSGGKPVLSHS